MALIRSISAGMQVKIYEGNPGKLVTNVPLILEEDMVLNLNSSFAPLVGNAGNKLTSLASALTRDIGAFSLSTQFKQFGFQVWEKTDPIGFSFTVGLHMDTNARQDVWEPATTLMKLPLPTDLGIDKKGAGLQAPGPSVLAAAGQVSRGRQLFLKAGIIYLNPIIIKKVEPVITRFSDTQDYPIMVTLRIDAETIYTATTNMIDNFTAKGV